MSGSSSSSDDGEDTWIQWFCALEGHEMFCEVDRSYIEDGFNLYGLRHWVPSINDSLDVILDRVSQHEASHELMEATCALYGLIHARYVLTTGGLEAMCAKYTRQEFGNCPHFMCRGQPVVPLGVRDEPHMETVKLFCPKCQDVYVHPSHAAQRVDGAYFGTTFPHLFFMTYGGMIPDPLEQKFVPRVFGFRVHPSAANGAYGRDLGRGQGQQHERNLEERRRLRRPPPGPSGTPDMTAVASSTVAASAVAAAGAAAAAFGGGGVAGGGRKNGDDGKQAGKVLVQIKAEEEWERGLGADGPGGGAGAGAGTNRGRRGRRDLNKGEGGEGGSGEERREASGEGKKVERGSGSRARAGAGDSQGRAEVNGHLESPATDYRLASIERNSAGELRAIRPPELAEERRKAEEQKKRVHDDRERVPGDLEAFQDAVLDGNNDRNPKGDSKDTSEINGYSGGRNGGGAIAEDTVERGEESAARKGRDNRKAARAGSGATEEQSGIGGTGNGGRRTPDFEGIGDAAARSRTEGSQDGGKRQMEAEPESVETPDDGGGNPGGGGGAPGPNRARGKIPRGRNNNVHARALPSVVSSSALPESPSGRRTRGSPLT